MRLTARLSVCIALCLVGLTGAVHPAMAISLVPTGVPETTPQAFLHRQTRLTALTERLQAVAQTIDADIAKGNASASRTELLKIIAQPEFADLNPVMRWAGYYMLAGIENAKEDNEAAFEHMQLARDTGAADTQFEHWRLLLDIAYTLGKNDVRAEAMSHMLRIDPEQVNGFNARYVFGVVSASEDLNDNGAAHKALLEALWQGKYTPNEPFWSGDVETLWLSLFEIYINDGQTDKAEAILPVLTRSDSVRALRIDNRYRHYALAANADYAAAQIADLDRMHREVAANPRVLYGHYELARELLRQNRLSEALEGIDEALQMAASAPKDKPAFDDGDEYIKWMQDVRADVLARFGRWDEVLTTQLKARETAMILKEDTASQTINLGDIYVSLGRPKEALSAVKSISDKNASLYGQMAAAEVKVCAYAQLDDSKNTEKLLTFMRANAKEGIGPFKTALLCTNKMDELAKVIIEQLDDPQKRNETLRSVQSYLPTPDPAPQDRILIVRYQTLLAREDIKAAIKRYGVIESFPVFGPFY